jgi:hypothetical protein
MILAVDLLISSRRSTATSACDRRLVSYELWLKCGERSRQSAAESDFEA